MNGNYYNNPTFPGTSLNNGTVPNQQSVPSYEANIFPAATDEQSYIENILRLNKGKVGKFHVTIPSSNDWRDKIFTGVIEQAGRDHIIVSNPTNGEWYLILMIYLDYVTFDEPINYIKQF
ncbi:MAG: spore coat protein GerQ [Bacilli bacterium]